VRTAGIQFFPEIELAVLYLIAAVVLLVKPTGFLIEQALDEARAQQFKPFTSKPPAMHGPDML
jgi:choline-glycine betaine transporter